MMSLLFANSKNANKNANKMLPPKRSPLHAEWKDNTKCRKGKKGEKGQKKIAKMQKTAIEDLVACNKNSKKANCHNANIGLCATTLL